jgi:hypothetical protein
MTRNQKEISITYDDYYDDDEYSMNKGQKNE